MRFIRSFMHKIENSRDGEKIYTHEERERETAARMKLKQCQFLWRCDDDEKICTYEIYIRCYTLDLKESLSTWPYEWMWIVYCFDCQTQIVYPIYHCSSNLLIFTHEFRFFEPI